MDSFGAIFSVSPLTMEQSGPIRVDLILISLSISLSRPSEIGAGAAVWEGGER